MIPDYQALMGPVLKTAANGEVRISDVVEALSKEFQLTENERAELLPSGKQTIIANRVHWAKTYLKQAGLVEPTKRGHFQITERGKAVLSGTDIRIDNNFLKTFEEFRDFQTRCSEDVTPRISPAPTTATVSTPEEVMRAAYDEITATVASELVDRLRIGTPAFFERTIVSLLLAMGYGGSSSDAGRAIGQSGDDGVDGVIDQDPLGVDQIYVQAKRYAENNTIGSAAIREFYGSLSLKKSAEGHLRHDI